MMSTPGRLLHRGSGRVPGGAVSRSRVVLTAALAGGVLAGGVLAGRVASASVVRSAPVAHPTVTFAAIREPWDADRVARVRDAAAACRSAQTTLTVHPGAFTYTDGSFVDRGIVAGHPGGHQVVAGAEYVFDVDYSRLAEDPGGPKGAGRFEYRSGTRLVGSWR